MNIKKLSPKVKDLLAVCLLLLVLFGSLLWSQTILAQTPAGSYGEMRGWLWSDNIGWISLNSKDAGSNFPYAVKVLADSTFSGYAWSDNIGWISFNPVTVGATVRSAKLATDGSGKITGWAFACSGLVDHNCTSSQGFRTDGWDGIISLDSQTAPAYGGVVDITKKITGFVWGDQVIGWASFVDSSVVPTGGHHWNPDNRKIEPDCEGNSVLTNGVCAECPVGTVAFEGQCRGDICLNGADNPPTCSTCPAGKKMDSNNICVVDDSQSPDGGNGGNGGNGGDGSGGDGNGGNGGGDLKCTGTKPTTYVDRGPDTANSRWRYVGENGFPLGSCEWRCLPSNDQVTYVLRDSRGCAIDDSSQN